MTKRKEKKNDNMMMMMREKCSVPGIKLNRKIARICEHPPFIEMIYPYHHSRNF